MSDSPFCPSCASSNTTFKKKASQWECEDCEQRFTISDSSRAPRGRVFLSYGHDPACVEIVQRIKLDLQAQGWEPWVDDKGIRFGDDWRREITKGIQDSQHVLAFLSQHSTRKPGVCRQEVAIALGPRKGHVYTVLVEPLERVSPPLVVSHLQWLDMQQWQELKAKDTQAYEALYKNSLQEILRVLERNEPFAGDIELLQRWLDPLDGTADMLAAEEGFIGRRWLLDGLVEQPEDETQIGEIERWRTSGSSDRVFWLSAGPGWGKSAVAARLAHAARSRVMAVHYCRYNKPNTRDARQVVRTLAFQMATQLGDFRELLVRQAKQGASLAELNALELFDKLLANPLVHELGGGRSPNDRHLIVLDALDETLENDQSELLNLVAGEFGKLPTWLGIVVTSRPEAPVKRQLSAFGVQHQSEDDPRNLDDLRAYVLVWLEGLELQAAQRNKALSAVVDASAGMFLYVRQLREAVSSGVVSAAQLTDPASLPKGLAGLYERWFQARFKGDKGQKDYDDWQRPLLELMLAAREPLPLALASAVLAWGVYGEANALEPLGSMCSLQGGTVSLFHKSLADWLSRPEESGRRFHASPTQGHQRLSTGLRNAYTQWCEAGAFLKAGEGWKTLGVDGEVYALRHICTHLIEANRPQDARNVLVDFALAMRRCAAGAHEAIVDDHLKIGLDQACADLEEWGTMLNDEGYLLRRHQPWWPPHRLLLQMAMERDVSSPLRKTAEQWRAKDREGWPWLLRDVVSIDEGSGNRKLIEMGQGRAVDVRTLAVSWQALHVAVSFSNEEVRIFDLNTGRQVHRLESVGSCLGISLKEDTLVCYHPNGSSSLRSLTSGSVEHKAALGLLSSLEVNGRGLRRISRNGLVSITWDGLHTLLIESEDPLISPVRQALPANAKVISMAVSDDGSSYAVACRDGAVWYWGSDVSQRQRHLQSGKDPIYGLDITDDGQWIATVGKDCVLRVWNASEGALKFAATGHAYLATRVCLAPDGKQAVTTGQDGKLILWDLSLAKAEIRPAEVTSIVEVMDDAGGARWITSDGGGNLNIYSSSTFDLPPLKNWRAHKTKIWDLAVAPDGQHLVTAGEDGLARVWHRETGACIANIVSVKGKAFYATAISPDGRWLVVAGADKCPQVHDLQAALKGQTPVDPPHELATGFTLKCRSEIEKLIFLDSGHFLSGDRSGMVRCWNVKNSEPLWEIKHHDEVVNSPDRPKYGSEQKGVYALSVAQSGRYLACSGRGIDRGISIWDLGGALCDSAPTLVHVLHGHERGVNFLAFRDDDQHLVSASWDETVVMWDWRERERLLLRPIPNLSATLVTGNKLAVGIGLVGTGLGELFTLSFQNIPVKRVSEA